MVKKKSRGQGGVVTGRIEKNQNGFRNSRGGNRPGWGITQGRQKKAGKRKTQEEGVGGERVIIWGDQGLLRKKPVPWVE